MDSKSAAAIAEKAQAQNVPVVSYDRLIENGEVDAYVSFDNERVGELQAETLAKKLKEDGNASGPIIKINGDPADPNAALFKAGSNKGFEAAGVKVAKEYDTPGWSAENAQREAQQAITALGNDGFCRHLRRQRRHRRRRDRGAEGRRHRPGRTARSPVRTRPSPACSGSSPASSS